METVTWVDLWRVPRKRSRRVFPEEDSNARESLEEGQLSENVLYKVLYLQMHDNGGEKKNVVDVLLCSCTSA